PLRHIPGEVLYYRFPFFITLLSSGSIMPGFSGGNSWEAEYLPFGKCEIMTFGHCEIFCFAESEMK
ncbi:MAG: hypothetical protein IJA70_04115, partial [Oscillospiraceae bacterium]|nr:hypothetical protein [Oscillospiraceae bacterium]